MTLYDTLKKMGLQTKLSIIACLKVGRYESDAECKKILDKAIDDIGKDGVLDFANIIVYFDKESTKYTISDEWTTIGKCNADLDEIISTIEYYLKGKMQIAQKSEKAKCDNIVLDYHYFKRCPFCDSELIMASDENPDYRDGFTVRCMYCDANIGKNNTSITEAVTKWNKRARQLDCWND